MGMEVSGKEEIQPVIDGINQKGFKALDISDNELAKNHAVRKLCSPRPRRPSRKCTVARLSHNLSPDLLRDI